MPSDCFRSGDQGTVLSTTGLEWFFIASSFSFHSFSETFIALTNPFNKKIILDLACGPGLFTCPVVQRSSGWVIGFDLSLPMLRRARKKAFSQGINNVLFVRGSAFRLPFREAVFDAILCSGDLHLFDHPEVALQEIARVLSAQGRFVGQTTIPQNIRPDWPHSSISDPLRLLHIACRTQRKAAVQRYNPR